MSIKHVSFKRWSEVHGTHIIKQFSLFGANSYDIALKYL